jgi:hypothetical protein
MVHVENTPPQITPKMGIINPKTASFIKRGHKTALKGINFLA